MNKKSKFKPWTLFILAAVFIAVVLVVHKEIQIKKDRISEYIVEIPFGA